MSGRITMPRWIIAAFLFLGVMCAPAHAEKRVALVIGNSAYTSAVPLDNPANDAKLMSDTLLSLGFFVVGGGAKLDLDRSGLESALGEFGRAVIGADVALLYYAGHGVEIRDQNYLVPVDAHPDKEADVISGMTPLSGILDRMQQSGARLNLLLLDACRDNPFRDHGVNSKGLAQVQAPPGTLISFATQPHGVSLDGEDGHSPYTRALADAMKHPDYGLFRTFNEVGLAVESATHGEQLPWLASSPISGKFYFAGKQIATNAPVQATKPDERQRRDLITDCDRLAATRWDTGNPPGIAGVDIDKIVVARAAPACTEAMRLYPDVMRFTFESGRVAQARKDFVEARRLYQKAADGGYRMGMNNLGAMYEGSRQGVPMDHVEAVRWYTKAADAGEPIAMTNLAWMYENGLGVKKNCAEAVRLNQTATKAGYSPAMSNLALFYYDGKCVERDYAEARRLNEQALAADPSNDYAMNSIGVMVYAGNGYPRNKALGRQWFEKAAALGNPQAKQNLKD
jgi:tetratricopeptide (TPR) repeat protein